MADDYAAVAARVQAELGDQEGDVYDPALLHVYINKSYETVARKLTLHGDREFRGRAAIAVPIAATSITATSTPALPADLFLPIAMFEQSAGDPTGQYVPMRQVSDIPVGTPQTDTLGVWEWRQDSIFLVGATRIVNVDLRYWRSLTTIAAMSDRLGLEGALDTVSRGAAWAAASSRLGAGDKNVLGLKAGFDEALNELTALHVKSNQMRSVSPNYRWARNAKRRRRNLV